MDYRNIKKAKIKKKSIILTDINGNTVSIDNTEFNRDIYNKYISKSNNIIKVGPTLALITIVSGVIGYNATHEKISIKDAPIIVEKPQNISNDNLNNEQQITESVEEEYNQLMEQLDNFESIDNSEKFINEYKKIMVEDRQLIELYESEIDVDNLIRNIQANPAAFFTSKVKDDNSNVTIQKSNTNFNNLIVLKDTEFDELKNNNQLQPNSTYVTAYIKMKGILRIHEINKNHHYPVFDSKLVRYQTDENGKLEEFDISLNPGNKWNVTSEEIDGILGFNHMGEPVYDSNGNIINPLNGTSLVISSDGATIRGHNFNEKYSNKLLGIAATTNDVPNHAFGNLTNYSFDNSIITLTTSEGATISQTSQLVEKYDEYSISHKVLISSMKYNKETGELYFDEETYNKMLKEEQDQYNTEDGLITLSTCNSKNKYSDMVFTNKQVEISKKLINEITNTNNPKKGMGI